MTEPLQPSMKDLEDPAFLEYLKKRFPGKINPDEKDYDASDSGTDAEKHRKAQARRLIRLWREWKAQLS